MNAWVYIAQSMWRLALAGLIVLADGRPEETS